MRRCCTGNQCQAHSQKSRCVQERHAALNVCAFGTAGPMSRDTPTGIHRSARTRVTRPTYKRLRRCYFLVGAGDGGAGTFGEP